MYLSGANNKATSQTQVLAYKAGVRFFMAQPQAKLGPAAEVLHAALTATCAREMQRGLYAFMPQFADIKTQYLNLKSILLQQPREVVLPAVVPEDRKSVV